MSIYVADEVFEDSVFLNQINTYGIINMGMDSSFWSLFIASGDNKK